MRKPAAVSCSGLLGSARWLDEPKVLLATSVPRDAELMEILH
jgi:hypothetical protein